MDEQGQQSTQECEADIWMRKLDTWRASGISAAAWCRLQNEKYNIFFYWHKKLIGSSSQSLSRSKFKEIACMSALSCVEITAGDIMVRVAIDFDDKTLFRVLHVVKSLP